MWKIIRLEIMQIKYEEINKIETKPACLLLQKEKKKVLLI